MGYLHKKKDFAKLHEIREIKKQQLKLYSKIAVSASFITQDTSDFYSTLQELIHEALHYEDRDEIAEAQEILETAHILYDERFGVDHYSMCFIMKKLLFEGKLNGPEAMFTKYIEKKNDLHFLDSKNDSLTRKASIFLLMLCHPNLIRNLLCLNSFRGS